MENNTNFEDWMKFASQNVENNTKLEDSMNFAVKNDEKNTKLEDWMKFAGQNVENNPKLEDRMKCVCRIVEKGISDDLEICILLNFKGDRRGSPTERSCGLQTLPLLTPPLCTVGWIAKTEIVVLANSPICSLWK